MAAASSLARCISIVLQWPGVIHDRASRQGSCPIQAQERFFSLMASTSLLLLASGSTTGSIMVPTTPSARIRTGLRSRSA